MHERRQHLWRIVRAGVFFVLWQAVFVQQPIEVLAQTKDSVKTDSNTRVTFASQNREDRPLVKQKGRSIQMMLVGGLGYRSPNGVLEPTGNVEFLATNSILDIVLGLHYDFSSWHTRGLSMGGRFPIVEGETFADAAILVSDFPGATVFETGVRADLGYRPSWAEHIEGKLAVEWRSFPTSSDPGELWVGLELGYIISLTKSGLEGPTRKDSLRLAIRRIATDDELSELDLTRSNDDIDDFLDRFWKVRESAAHGQTVPLRQEFERRVDEANKQFSHGRKLGVETDQGRVWLLYGQPDRIETAVSILEGERRYELWVYSKRVRGYSSAVMLFETDHSSRADARFRSGDTREVYSNVSGEPSEGIPNDLPTTLLSWIMSFAH